MNPTTIVSGMSEATESTSRSVRPRRLRRGLSHRSVCQVTQFVAGPAHDPVGNTGGDCGVGGFAGDVAESILFQLQ